MKSTALAPRKNGLPTMKAATISQLANQLHKAFKEAGEAEGDALLVEIDQKHGREIAWDVLNAWFGVIKAERVEAEAKYLASKQEYTELMLRRDNAVARFDWHVFRGWLEHVSE